MRPEYVKTLVKTTFNTTKRTICLEGPPGGGKTTVITQIAAELGVPCIVKHLPTMLVEDFGVLFPNGDDTLHYKLPDWFPVAGKAPEKGILLFDDSNQANTDLQKVMANICQDRTLHGHRMPDGWMVIRTGNRQSDRAGSNRVLSHLRNRETVIEFEAHLDDWTNWAMANNVHPVGIAFIRMRPDLLHHFDPQREVSPTPRGWVEGVFSLFGALPPEIEFETYKGAVGEGEAAEYTGFLRVYRDMPDPDQCLKAPTTTAVPTDTATRYALTAALAQRATPETFGAICQYMARMPGEFGALCVQQAMARSPEVVHTQAFQQWAVKNYDLLK